MAALPMRETLSPNAEAAFRLAALGLHVFPCQPDKRPQAGLKWAALSSNDPEQARRWWSQHPAALPAIDCGKSGLVVIDLDRKPGGADGVDAFARLCDEYGALNLMQEVPAVATAGGGLHLIFAMPSEPLGNSTGALPAGIDIRGKGGYVIGEGATREDAPAWHAAGDGAGLVEWLKSGQPLPTLPGWLLGILRAEKQRTTSLPAPAGGIGQEIGQRERAAFAAALQGECSEVQTAPAGGRNNRLNTAAFNLGQMVAAGWGSRTEVFAALQQAASAAGLPQGEAVTTILSGLKAGQAQPRPPLVERERQPVAARAIMDPSPLLAGHAGGGQGVALTASPAAIEALPFHWIDPAGIPPRRWLYGKHLIRGFVSATVAPGGVGKSALTMAEAVAIATGQPILGIKPAEQVPVWLVNLEDPMDELYRRLMAIALYYGLTEQDLGPGRFYVNSGRETPLIIAESTRDGTRIARPVIEEVKAQIVAKGIGLMIIDPFVASHRVQENDNPAINAVASAWREIAEATGCAIELVHHTRKTGGLEVTVEDARGGNALHGAVRSMRAINGMSKEEAARFGVDNHRQFFRLEGGKMNLAPASANAEWFQIVSLDLGNATPDRPSDHVGVVERWALPDPLEGVTAEHVGRVQSALLAGGSYRRDPQASDWVGHLVGRVIGVDTGPGLRGASLSASHRAARAKVSQLISKWIGAGALREERGLDAKRNERVFVVAGDLGEIEFATP